jgi:gamma-glutamyltranspeptidase/glutathione hydrolase
LIVETMKRAYCDRARHLGDDAFVKIPAHLTTKAYAQRLAAGIDRGRATPSEQLAPELLLTDEGDSTTHFSVIDADAMAVSNTYTLEHGYGARIVVRGAGFLLNNEMGDFNRYPGRTDREGNIGTEANWIAPGKRMLSSQTPVIVLRNGRVKLLTGSPGGRTIINTVLSVVLGSLEFQQGIREAVDAPRLHHQWLPDQISFEGYGQPLYAGTVKALEAMGHKFVPKGGRQGDAHSIWVGDRVFYGAPDSRSESAAAAP